MQAYLKYTFVDTQNLIRYKSSWLDMYFVVVIQFPATNQRILFLSNAY